MVQVLARHKGILALGAILALSAGLVGGVGHPATASAKSLSGGSLVIGEADADPGNFDPIATFTLAWGEIASNIFDGLVFRTPTLKIQPGLATSWKWLNTTHLVMQLRHNVLFQDGEPFNSGAVVFTFDRLTGPLGQKGPEYANYNAIEKVQALGTYEVEFTLSHPDPTLITKLAGYGAMIVPPKYIEKYGTTYFGTHPIGTGPFKMVKYVKGSEVVLQRFDKYWRGPAKLAQVTFEFVTEDSTRLADLQTGAIDIMQNVPVAQASVVKGNSALHLMPVSSPTVFELGTDMSVAPTNNQKVRLAIAEAINMSAIIKTVLHGYAQPISTFQGPLSFGNDPHLKPYPYDPTQSKALLQQAGVKAGTTVTLGYVGSDSTFEQVAQAVAGYLQQVGLQVNLEPYDENTFFNNLIPAGQGKAGDLWEFGWGGWTLDFDNTAVLLYTPKQFWNPTYSNPEVTSLIDAERSTLDTQARLADFYKLDTILHDQVVGIPLYDVTNLWATDSRVHGFVAPPDDRVWLWPVSVSQ